MTGTSVFSGLRVALPGAADLDAAARLIRQVGGHVHRFSMRVEQGSALPLERWLVELTEGEFDDVVFLSAQSVRLLVEFARQLDREDEVVSALRAARKIARGPKTAAAIRE